MKVLALLSIALIGYSSGMKQCATPLDVVLVVEDSSVLPDNGIAPLQTFLASIVNYLTIDAQHIPNPYDQAAYVLYNNSATSIFHLNSHPETTNTRSAILRQPFSRTADPSLVTIEQGLKYAYNTELTVVNGERSCYGTVVILVSYSSYHDVNGFGNNPLADAQKAADLTASRNLINSGALIITVGVGPKRNPLHLQNLATSPEFYIDYEEFYDLTEDQGVNIAQLACGFIPTGNFFPCEMQTVQADITFVVDTSNAFTPALADDITAFMQKFLTPYTYDHKIGVQAALVTYSKAAQVEVAFSDADNLATFLSKVNSSFSAALACPTCRTDNRCIYQALEQVNYAVLVPPSFRSTCAVHYVFIFTAGCFNCEDPIPLSKLIRADKNTEIFVVPLQNYQPPGGSAAYPFGFWKEALEIADDNSHLLEAQADPKSILANYLHKQSWRNVCVSRNSVICPTTAPATPSPLPATTTAFAPRPTTSLP